MLIKHLTSSFTNRTFERNIPKLVFVRRCYYSAQTHLPRQLHKHDFLEINLTTKGSGTCIVNGVEYPMFPGSLILINDGDIHAENPEINKDIDFWCITVSNIQLPRLRPNCLVPDSEKNRQIDTGDQFPLFSSLLNMLFQQQINNNVRDNAIIHHGLITLLLSLLNIFNIDSSRIPDSSLSEYHISNVIKDYIDRNYYEKLTLEKISTALKISPSLLSHSFKKSFGISPIQYLTNLRIGESQTILTATNLPITEIAALVGYDMPGSFYTMFNRIVGCSPTYYRKYYAEIQNEQKR